MADLENPTTNGNHSDDESDGGSQGPESDIEEVENVKLDRPKSVLKKSSHSIQPIEAPRPELPPQPDPSTLDISALTPLSPEIIARQATINIGTIGHVAHGKVRHTTRRPVCPGRRVLQVIVFNRHVVHCCESYFGRADSQVSCLHICTSWTINLNMSSRFKNELERSQYMDIDQTLRRAYLVQISR